MFNDANFIFKCSDIKELINIYSYFFLNIYVYSILVIYLYLYIAHNSQGKQETNKKKRTKNIP